MSTTSPELCHYYSGEETGNYLTSQSLSSSLQHATPHSLKFSIPLFQSQKIHFLKSLLFFTDLIYLFLNRGEGGRKRKRNISVWLPLLCPLLETWPTTHACTLTGNWTSNPLVHRLVLNPLCHTSQSEIHFAWFYKNGIL